jgi:ABC-type nitrate/sulfonate/bicarbonate transport system permease component
MAVIEQPGAASVALEPERASSLRVPGMALWRLASLALFCGLWEVAGRIPINPAFPPFSDTLAAFARMTADGSLPRAFFITLQPLAVGVIVSALLGVSVGVLIGLRRIAEWLIAPIFIVLQAAPMAALIPLVTFVYGIGITAKIMSVCILALPVIVLNSYKAIRNVNPSLIAMCRSFLGSRPQQIVKIMLPDAAPLIFAGLRLGVSAGFIGVILAELLITPTGIGDLITFHQSTASYPEMYAAITSIVAFSALTLMVLQWVEVRLFRPEMRGA